MSSPHPYSVHSLVTSARDNDRISTNSSPSGVVTSSSNANSTSENRGRLGAQSHATPSTNSSGYSTRYSLTPSDLNAFSPPPSFANKTSRSSTRSTTKRPATFLGSIDENSASSSPDRSSQPEPSSSATATPPSIPAKSPRRVRFGDDPKLFLASLFPGAKNVKSFEEADDVAEKEVYGPRGEKFSDLRHNTLSTAPRSSSSSSRFNCRRWSWRIWALVLLVLVMLIAITAIGLVVGLKTSHHHHHSSSSSSTNSTNPTTGFPTGTWNIITPLLSVATNCTSNPSTWRCYPYQTYTQSQSGSTTTLTWIITGTTDTSTGVSTYTVASSTNPFALPFSDAALTLANPGEADEYWTFSTMQTKLVVPDAALPGAGGSSVDCYYDNAVLMGKLYTRKKATIGGQGGEKGQWPYAVEVAQTSAQGPGCYKMVNGANGAAVPVEAGQGGGCGCFYGDVQE